MAFLLLARLHPGSSLTSASIPIPSRDHIERKWFQRPIRPPRHVTATKPASSHAAMKMEGPRRLRPPTKSTHSGGTVSSTATSQTHQHDERHQREDHDEIRELLQPRCSASPPPAVDGASAGDRGWTCRSSAIAPRSGARSRARCRLKPSRRGTPGRCRRAPSEEEMPGPRHRQPRLSGMVITRGSAHGLRAIAFHGHAKDSGGVEFRAKDRVTPTSRPSGRSCASISRSALPRVGRLAPMERGCA